MDQLNWTRMTQPKTEEKKNNDKFKFKFNNPASIYYTNSSYPSAKVKNIQISE